VPIYSEKGECAFALIEPIHYGVDLGRDDDVHRIYYSFFEELIPGKLRRRCGKYRRRGQYRYW